MEGFLYAQSIRTDALWSAQPGLQGSDKATGPWPDVAG